jgi:hypothetical protein
MRHFLYAAAALAAFATPVSAETIAITGGRVVIGDGSAPIEGGTVDDFLEGLTHTNRCAIRRCSEARSRVISDRQQVNVA